VRTIPKAPAAIKESSIMRSGVVSLAIVGSILLGLGHANAQVIETNPDQTGPKTQQTTTETLPPGEYVGKLLSVNASRNSVVLQVTIHRKVLKNPDGPARTFEQISNDIDKDTDRIGKVQRDAVISRSLAEYQRKRQEADKETSKFQQGLQKQLNQLQDQHFNPQPVEYVTLSERKDAQLTTAKDVKVRLRELPTIDDDGRVRTKYTADEVRKLKGDDPDQPGYNGKLRNLNPGEFVRVTVAPKQVVVASDDKGEEVKRQNRANATEVTAIIVITREQAVLNEASRP
jgi:hypothetical protein